MIQRPMLACNSTTVEEHHLSELLEKHGPLYGTPKIDGIRCLTCSEGGVTIPLSRTFTPIPNAAVRAWFSESTIRPGSDGELVVPGKTFNGTQSLLMTRYSVPFDWIYYIFDKYPTSPTDKRSTGYLQRLQDLKSMYRFTSRTRLLFPEKLSTPSEVMQFFRLQLKEGFEGAILRSKDGPYKEGRATWNEGYMFKMTEWSEFEALIIGMVPKMENNNPTTKDKRGYTKRGKSKGHLVVTDALGALRLRDIKTGVEFKIGSGWTEEEAQSMWDNQDELIGEAIVTCKKKVHGEKNKPRSPVWKGIRESTI